MWWSPPATPEKMIPSTSIESRTALAVASASTKPIPVSPRTTLFPAIVPRKNRRPLKAPTSVTG